MCKILPFAAIRLAVACFFLWGACAVHAGEAAHNNANDNGAPADTEITRAIERKLLLSHRVPSHWIDVRTQDGIVTLTGTVDNLLSKDRATELAAATRGVRAVVNLVTVKTPVRSDTQIRKDVIHAIAADPVVDTSDIAVKVGDGVVTLKGSVESWAEKRVAARVVKGVKGIREVKNEIAFDYPTSRSDSEIAADIRARLRWDPRVDDGLMKVAVEQGNVSLTGSVGSAAEKNFAYADAWVAGVRNVDNRDLKVQWWARDKMQRPQACAERTDQDLKLAVQGALIQDPRVSFFKPEIEVDNHRVTLTGIVDNLKAKKAAGLDAKHTACVLRVKNHLKVRPFKVLPDEVVADEVRSAFARDPYITGSDIGVSVSNGKVFLYGQVDTIHDLIRAEDLTSRINGVVEVQNSLRLRDILNARTDREIKEEIQDQLWWSPFVDSESISVSVTDGVATLTGTAHSRREAEAAATNARQGGAEKVVNRLRILGYPDAGFW